MITVFKKQNILKCLDGKITNKSSQDDGEVWKAGNFISGWVFIFKQQPNDTILEITTLHSNP
jgi:hypothetical protein